MEVTILGSGGWEGIPVPFCTCHVCLDAEKNPSGKNARTRPEILVKTNSGSFLIEISPDFRLQSTHFKLPPISDFLVSHWHFDHLYGLLELHTWSRLIMKGEITICCSEKTNDWICKSFAHIPKKVNVLKPFFSFILMGVKITPFPVYHMFHQDDLLSPCELQNTFGFLLEENGKKVAYLADYYRLPSESIELIQGSDLIIADGTYLLEEYFPSKLEQNGLKSDPDHIHGKKVIEFVQSLNAKKTIFHSITHLHEKKHNEILKLLPKGLEPGFDGMQFTF